MSSADVVVGLKYYGHEKVYVLQGGAAAWQAAGHPWTTAVVQPLHTTFVARPRPAMRATKAQVLKAVHDPETTIIETRRQQNIVEAGVAAASIGKFTVRGLLKKITF